MDPVLAPIIAAQAAEALKSWGPFTIVLSLLGAALWRALKKIEKLEGVNERLQEARLQDAQEMRRVAEAGTATMQARLQQDALSLTLMRAMDARMAITPPLVALPQPESR